MSLRHFLMSALLTLGAVLTSAAQMMPEPTPLPLDSAVRTGVLPNGLTYMIRHNEYPKGQADFFIAQKVGSMLEEDNQRGLAHFLEHMAFNGTKNFPGNRLREWLASKGVMFGRDLNAYTSFDETVYNVSAVPTGNTAVEDSCLLILHDWAGALTLADDAINEERGVIEQEWRRSSVGMMRILEGALPVLFPEGRYGHRLPIGTMDVVLNFEPEALRDYYRRWYRPDQQGIIVVGDIDVDRIEGRIKEMFADLSVPAGAPERVYEAVAPHQGTRAYVGTDPEMNVAVAQLFFARPPMPREYKGANEGLIMGYLNDMVTSMLNQRLSDIAAKPTSPFLQASVSDGKILGALKGLEALTLVAVGKDGKVEPALESAYREILRAARGGFTQSEYDRAKADFMSELEKQRNNVATHPSTAYARDYVSYFVDGDATPGIELEYKIYETASKMIPLVAVNQYFAGLAGPDDRYLLAALPEKEGVEAPTTEALLALLAAVDSEDIEPLKDEMRTDPLIRRVPIPGTVTSVKELPQWGATEWTLSNGARVIFKPTKLKEDEILLIAQANHGWATYDAMSDATVRTMELYLSKAAIGAYSSNDLAKLLAGKNLAVNPSYEENRTVISAMTTVKDLPDMMEMLYGTMSDPNIDEEEYAAMGALFAEILSSADTNPDLASARLQTNALYKASRKQFPDAAAVTGASRDELVKYMSAMTADASKFTFIIVGNTDAETLRPLVEKYVASLPSQGVTGTEQCIFPEELEPVKGEGTDEATMVMQTPQVTGIYTVMGDMPYTMKNVALARLADGVLTDRLIMRIREQMQATYSIRSNYDFDRAGKPNFSVSATLMLKPELADSAVAEVQAIFASMATTVTPDELSKNREIALKDYAEAMEKNRQWLLAIAGLETNGVDTLHGFDEALRSITPEDVKAFFGRLLAQGNKRTVLMRPQQ